MKMTIPDPAPMPAIEHPCVIQENDETVVIAVPIARTQIKALLPLMAALSEAGAGPSGLINPLPRERTSMPLTTAIQCILIAAIFGAALSFGSINTNAKPETHFMQHRLMHNKGDR